MFSGFCSRCFSSEEHTRHCLPLCAWFYETSPSFVNGWVFLWEQGVWVKAEDGLMDRRFLLTFLFCSVSWIFFWEVRWKKGKESQIEEWLQGHNLSEYRHLFEGQWERSVLIRDGLVHFYTSNLSSSMIVWSLWNIRHWDDQSQLLLIRVNNPLTFFWTQTERNQLHWCWYLFGLNHHTDDLFCPECLHLISLGLYIDAYSVSHT